VENVLSPSLAYLGKIVDTLEVERDTAFVIMPFKQPYASYYSMLYRPSNPRATVPSAPGEGSGARTTATSC